MKSFIQTTHVTGPPAEAEPCLQDIYLMLYDMLNDDDEELRGISANTASIVLGCHQGPRGGQGFPRVPLAAASGLAHYLATNYNTSPCLLKEAIQRLTGQRIQPSSPSLMVSVSTLLNESMEDSTILFEVEKQNLYIDDVREIEVWYNILRQLSSEAREISPSLAKDFPQWVLSGLLSLTRVAKLEGAGGLLGFTSKPDVFVIGLRVVYAARLLLSETSLVGLDFDKGDMLTRTSQLLTAGEAAWVPEQWLSCLRETACWTI